MRANPKPPSMACPFNAATTGFLHPNIVATQTFISCHNSMYSACDLENIKIWWIKKLIKYKKEKKSRPTNFLYFMKTP